MFVGLGANLPGLDGAAPLATCKRALAALEARLGACARLSSWYHSAPVPASGQPWFVNAVALFRTARRARPVLETLQAVEDELGRARGERWAARIIDLDLLAWGGALIDEAGLLVPHPRLSDRAFVLLPLAEIAPAWRHPRDGRPIEALLAAMPAGQSVVRLDDERAGGLIDSAGRAPYLG